jgi:PUB domain
MQVKLWKHEGGRALMTAVGFGPPVDFVTDGKMKSFVALSALPLSPAAQSDKSKKRLPTEVVEAVKTRRKEIEQEVIALEGAPSVSAAIRSMRQTHSLVEVRTGVETALSIVRNVLKDPKDIKLHRVKKSNPVFQRTLGRLRGSELLMRAVGFLDGDAAESPDNAAYVLKSSFDDHPNIGTDRAKGAGEITNSPPLTGHVSYILYCPDIFLID